MQHILNIAFDFDDDKVKKTVNEAIENGFTDLVKQIILDKIAPMEQGWYGKKERNWARLNNAVDQSIAFFLDEHKEEIIDRAAKKISASVRNTKAFKSKVNDILEEE